MTKDELELLNDIEDGVLIDNPISKEELKNYQNYAKHTKELSKKKQTTIRFNVNDLAIVKAKAKENGIGYQNLIQTLVHSYALGEIKIKL